LISASPRLRTAGAAGALVLALTALAAGGWPSADEPGASASPAPPPAPIAAPAVRSTGSTQQPGSYPGSVPLDPDVFVPPLDIGTPFRLAVPDERVTGLPAVENADGIVVHERLAPFIRTLLAEAEVAGVPLEGGGYRDSTAQRRLRAQNCPDPVNSPASACSPPTAKVGQSLHEYGLAIDFTSGGELILDRSSAAYRFLEANSGWNGLEVHPQEPWHWSYRP
jgi:hypothetical protein